LGAPARSLAAVNTIYVGNSNDTSVTSTCADPDFSTHASDEVTAQGAIGAALNAVDHDDDLIILCNGSYDYTSGIVQHNGTVGYDLITIVAEDAGDVTLDGNDSYQLLNFINTDVSITGVNFEDAYSGFSGAAIYIGVGSLAVADSTFAHNSAANEGGAIFGVNSDISIDESTFMHNESGEGGAISINAGVSGGDLTVTNSHFDDNSSWYGAITIDGNSSHGDIDISYSVMENNHSYGAESEGGAIYLENSLYADHVDFTNNTASWGGAILNYAEYGVSRETVITNSNFTDNTSGLSGGAVGTDSGTLVVNNSTFTNNVSGGDGGAIVAYGDTDARDGVLIENSTFIGNESGNADQWYGDGENGGGAIWAYYDVTVHNSSFEENVANDGTGGAVFGYYDVIVTKSAFVGNHADGADDWGGGAISADDNISVTGSTFSKNSSNENGGAIYADDFGSTYGTSGYEVEAGITGNTFSANTSAADGGAIAFDGMDYLVGPVGSNLFFNNRASGAGGGIAMSYRSNGKHLLPTRILRNTFRGNSARTGGGAALDYCGLTSVNRNFAKAMKSNKFSGNRGTHGTQSTGIFSWIDC
jgi:predicted outer membrane repeat protein